MGRQRDIAGKILEKKADHVLALKGNQAMLRDGVVFAADESLRLQGCSERHDRPGSRGLVIVESRREIPGSSPGTDEIEVALLAEMEANAPDVSWFYFPQFVTIGSEGFAKIVDGSSTRGIHMTFPAWQLRLRSVSCCCLRLTRRESDCRTRDQYRDCHAGCTTQYRHGDQSTRTVLYSSWPFLSSCCRSVPLGVVPFFACIGLHR